jgi:hypothetical protein
MDQSQQKPRKRRRWLIVAFVLLLVSLCTWWYWPRGDRRFVGKWKSNVASRYWTLKSNGQAVLESEPSIRTGGRQIIHTVWSSKGDTLTVGRSPYAGPRPLWQRWLIGQFNRLVKSHQIADVNPQECIELKLVERDRLEGVTGFWPDGPQREPNVHYLKHIIWFDLDDSDTKFGDINYRLRRIAE